MTDRVKARDENQRTSSRRLSPDRTRWRKPGQAVTLSSVAVDAEQVSADVVVRPARLSRWVPAIAVVQLAALLASSGRYGYHVDEMYFIIAGKHPAFGYPDQPPLVPLICAAMNAIAPHSLLVLRTPSALVSAATTALSGLIARQVGGTARAQVLAAATTACAGYALAVGHTVSTATFDMLSTTLLLWLVIRAVTSGSRVPLLLAGVVVGLGTEAKPQIALVAIVLLGILAAVGPRWPLATWELWVGGVMAAALAAPYVVWQASHGWPQLTVAHNIAGVAEGGRVGFVPFQLAMVSLFLVPVWVAGLVAPFRRGSWSDLRFVTFTYVAMGVLYVVGDGKGYYLASFYPALLALGAVPTAAWLSRGRQWLRRTALGAAFVLTLAINIPVALPLLPPDQLQGSLTMALNPDQGETVGWPAFVTTVATAWRGLAPAVRARTAIFTYAYNDAGAVDILGGSQGLPRSYSGHNGFSEWGRPPDRDTHTLLLGYDGPRDASPYFRDCRTLAHINDHVGLDNSQQGLPVMLCTPEKPWSQLWPQLRHYN
jgi:4-amino-4-deoxy-L-arabinose transferase-like glycosyltransferase